MRERDGGRGGAGPFFSWSLLSVACFCVTGAHRPCVGGDAADTRTHNLSRWCVVLRSLTPSHPHPHPPSFLSIVRTDLTRAWAADFTLEAVVKSLPNAEEVTRDVAHWLATATTHATLRPDDGGGLRLLLPHRPLPTGWLARYELPPRPGGAAAPLPPADVASRVGTVLTHAARMVKDRDALLVARDTRIELLEARERALERALARTGATSPAAAARARSGDGGGMAAAAAAHASQLLLSPPSGSQGVGNRGVSQAAAVARLASQAGGPPAATETGSLAPPPLPARPGVQVVTRKRGVGAPTAARGGATRARGAG